jgi:hypothetical protein
MRSGREERKKGNEKVKVVPRSHLQTERKNKSAFLLFLVLYYVHTQVRAIRMTETQKVFFIASDRRGPFLWDPPFLDRDPRGLLRHPCRVLPLIRLVLRGHPRGLDVWGRRRSEAFRAASSREGCNIWKQEEEKS